MQLREIMTHEVEVIGPDAILERSIWGIRLIKPGISTKGSSFQLTPYKSLTNDNRSSIEAKFVGRGYNYPKKEVLELVLATIQPVQARYREIMREPSHIDTILRQGIDRIRPVANQTMEEVRRATEFR